MGVDEAACCSNRLHRCGASESYVSPSVHNAEGLLITYGCTVQRDELIEIIGEELHDAQKGLVKRDVSVSIIPSADPDSMIYLCRHSKSSSKLSIQEET